METRHTILETKKVNKHFPGVHALADVDFNLCSGEIHGLVGHNGAGKSTLVKVLTGNYIPESGEVLLEGSSVHFKHPKDAIDCGVCIVTQEGTLVSSFTGYENIFLCNEPHKLGVVKNGELETRGRALQKETGLDNVNLSLQTGELNPAQRKIVEILKIIERNPKIVIFDESTASLPDKDRQLLFNIMRQFRDKGIGVIFITHYIDEILTLSDRITVMREGRIVGTIDGATATKQQIVQMMINREQKSEFPEYERNFGEVLLKAEHISDGRLVKDASIYIRKGEVVGIFGAVGSGRTELCEAIFGANKIVGGTLEKNGKPIRNRNTGAAIKNRLALIPEDRLKKALMLEDSIMENITLPFLKNYLKGFAVDIGAEIEAVDRAIEKLDIKTPSRMTKVDSLSGGNKQKVSFARWLSNASLRPELYIFDEPTEGVDIGACAEMYGIIAGLVQEGAGCIVISSDLSEVIGVSDRIYVMYEGKTAAEFSRDEDNLPYKLIAVSLGIEEEEEHEDH